MENYKKLKEKLLGLNTDVLSIINTPEIPADIKADAFETWRNTCHGIQQQQAEDIVRVAVVGPIKSGKSTVVNSLFNGDYLKRGAGVITAMLTKARRSSALGATLFFKSWPDINAELSRAMVMLPAMNVATETQNLDIRESEIRRALSDALADLPRESLIAGDSRNINSVLLSNYLEGYDQVRDIVQDTVKTRSFGAENFAAHRDYVADDRLAVYLQDIQLQINTGEMDPGIEIADCQGSDSPNPLHLAKIQDYLLTTNLIVYVISSRTGIRQADINFLSMIDRMGIADNLLFVINVDFNEHESLADLSTLIDRITEEIGLIKSHPEVHAFSGLFHLFQAQAEDEHPLSSKDARMLAQWQDDVDLVRFSRQGRRLFEQSLFHKLNQRRYTLLLRNNAERLALVTTGLNQWATGNLNLLAEDEAGARATFESTQQHKEKLDQAGAMLKSTLEGSARKLKKDLKAEVDRFFDPRAGEVMPGILNFIKNYNTDVSKYESAMRTSGFSNTLYMMFQEFKQSLDGFMAKTSNPHIMGFIKQQETRISEYFEVIADSYDIMAREALTQYRQAIADLGLVASLEDQPALGLRDLEWVKQQWQLELPAADFIMNYTARIRTEAVMRLGVYSAGKMIKKIFKRPVKDEKQEALRALTDGMQRMKKETENSLLFHFKNYRENIKFQYLLKLVEAVSEGFHKTVLDRFEAYGTDLSNIRQAVADSRIDKEQLSTELQKTSAATAALQKEIGQLIEAIKAIEVLEATGGGDTP